MKIKLITCLFIISLSTVSCMTRAPCDYQLDRQAGRLPEKENSEGGLFDVFHIRGMLKDSKSPIRIPPTVEKVWIYDQENDDGSFLQGTYLYFQLDNGHWLNMGDIKV